jgi:TatD-related deoxyribonuclease
MAVPILDNHVHLEELRGRHVDAVRDFQRAGGTHLIVSGPPQEEHVIKSREDWERSYDITIALKDKVNKETGVKAYATVGPYPAEILDIEKAVGLEKAAQLMMEGMEVAARYVREGKALAIGEVGRPHFPVSAEVWNVSNEIMFHAMRLAKDTDCAIVLHTESAGIETMKELSAMADKTGLAKHRVVKHFCPPFILPHENFGLMPSVLAGKDAVKDALSKGTRFLMETDFMDDLRKPGAVLGITTVPKRTIAFIRLGLMSEEQAFEIHQDNPRRTYGREFSQTD